MTNVNQLKVFSIVHNELGKDVFFSIDGESYRAEVSNEKKFNKGLRIWMKDISGSQQTKQRRRQRSTSKNS